MAINPNIVPQPHQQALTQEAEQAAKDDTDFRKLVLWHMGSGKGPVSLMAANALGFPYSAVVPAALRPNYIQEENKFTDKSIPSEVLSYNKITKGYEPPGQTVIFDEAGRLGRPSAQSRAAYELAKKKKHVLLLSGTPISNHPDEFSNIYNILTNNNLSQDEFANKFIKEKDVTPGGFFGRLLGRPSSHETVIDNEDELRKELQGKIDYYTPSKPNVPIQYQDIETDMSPSQANIYKGIWNKLPLLLKIKLKYDYGLTGKELRNLQSFAVGPRQIGLSELPFQDKPDPIKAFSTSGKLTKAFSELNNVLGNNPQSKAIIYSNFIRAGLDPYAAALKNKNIPHGMFHGGLNDLERKNMVNDFNNGKLRVALVGPAGAEGISLKGAQLIQLLDPHWNEARMNQAKARGLRFDSHIGLPEDLQNVTVQRYISKLPLSLKHKALEQLGVDMSRNREGTDDYLMHLAARKEKINQQFLEILKDIGTKKQADDLSDIVSSLDIDYEFIEKCAGVVSYVPRSAVSSVRQHGLLSSKAMLDRPDVLSLAASNFKTNPDDLKQSINSRLSGWKPESSMGPNVMFSEIPKTMVDKFPDNHPMKSMDLVPVHIDLDKLLADVPETKIHGQELLPYNEYLKKWTKDQLESNQDDPSFRHRNLSSEEINNYINTDPNVLWSTYYEDDGAGRYAPDVPHAAVITPDGRISTKYLNFDHIFNKTSTDLNQIKQLSDVKEYNAKTNRIRDLIKNNPSDWAIDSHQEHTVGLTHVPTGWRYHLPKHTLLDLFPEVRQSTLKTPFGEIAAV